MIKVLIVDDHDLFVEGMKSMFKPDDGISVTCHTQNGHEVPSILETEAVDVILMDIDMPILDGIATVELLNRSDYEIPVLMLTMHQSIRRIRGALSKGAQGYILKDASKSELIEAIQKVSKRQNYFHPKINDTVFEYFKGKSVAKNTLQELSEREIEIIQCLAEGKNTKAIADTLFISEHTVKTHRRNIMQKLGVKTSAELIKLAMDRELIQPSLASAISPWVQRAAFLCTIPATPAMSFQAGVEVDNILYFTLVLRTQAKKALEQSINTRPLFQIPKTGKTTLVLIIVVFVFALAVLQDYIYSRLQGTGFYLPESLLYNTFWVLFIPFTIAVNRLIRRVNSKNYVYKLPLHVAIGVVWSFLHILLFASVFVFVSNLVFSPAHRFAPIFNGALSNQLYIALLWYIVFPVIYISRLKTTKLKNGYAEMVRLKNGAKVCTVLTSSIQLISTDKPYSSIYVGEQKYLDGKSLKEFEKALDPTIFLRVHRSAIVNVKYIKELESRSNGDYDAKLENGQTIRLSRHYRNNWKQLLR